jgi:hypothetical protein
MGGYPHGDAVRGTRPLADYVNGSASDHLSRLPHVIQSVRVLTGSKNQSVTCALRDKTASNLLPGCGRARGGCVAPTLGRAKPG